MIHESGATVHAANKKHAARMSHHISFHEEADLKNEHFAFSLDRRLLQQGEGYISSLQNLETLSERFACTYNWSKRDTHLRGMVDSVILAHQVRVLVLPVGEDLGRLS